MTLIYTKTFRKAKLFHIAYYFVSTIVFFPCASSCKLLVLMFNPQRKNKLSHTYMEERSFQLHLQKMQRIEKSPSPIAPHSDEDPQRKYCEQISLSKLDIKSRKSSDIYIENHRLLMGLMEADRQTDLKAAELQPPMPPTRTTITSIFGGILSRR
jgi:hypothetical protein